MITYHADFAGARLLQLLLFLAAVLICIAAALFFREYPLLQLVIRTCAVVLAILMGCIGLPLYIRSLSCAVTSSQITVRRGIFFRREQSVLLRNVQFVRIIHGPCNGAFGLNFIILHVYGGMLTVAFLSRKDRLALTDFLRQKGVFHAP
ncbi:MAG: PH domain-containing protein [Ruminococcus sp.]|nr:PH domain-containing protein [Ruminococcus sp.]